MCKLYINRHKSTNHYYHMHFVSILVYFKSLHHSSLFLFFFFFFLNFIFLFISSFDSSMAASSTSKPDNITITVEKNPSDVRLSELGIKSWPKWGCPPGKFPLKFDAQETCYLLKGKVKAYTKGTSDCVEFGAGDLVTIPKGLSCTWDVSLAVDKHYKFDSPSSSSSSSSTT